MDKDNVHHPSESRNFFPKGYREFPKKITKNCFFFTFSRGGNPKYFFSREIKNTGKFSIIWNPDLQTPM